MRERVLLASLVCALLALAWAVPALGQRGGHGKGARPKAQVKRPAESRVAPKKPSRVAPRKQSRAAAKKAAPDPDLKGEQRRLRETQKQLKEQRERAEQARRREGAVLGELEQVSRRLAEKQREVVRLDARIRGTQAEVTTLQRDIGRLEKRRANQEALLGQRLQAIYKVHTQGGAIPVVLSGDDPVDRAVAVRHLTSLAALDARLIREYRETSEELADRKSRGEERQRELTELRGSAKQEQAEVDREAGRRRVLLAKVRDERAYHERMIDDLTESSRRLEGLIRELQARQRQRELEAQRQRELEAQRQRELEARQRQAAKTAPPRSVTPPPAAPPPAVSSSFRGRLPWPTAGRVVAPFGAQVHPRFGTRTFRNGVDIEAAEGTAVEAVLAGQVVYTGWFKGYGNLIIIDHGQDLFTLYAHVSEIFVKEGEDVRQGQRVGAVGDTGSLAGPRLYFEVRYRGKPQDPEQWLRQRG